MHSITVLGCTLAIGLVACAAEPTGQPADVVDPAGAVQQPLAKPRLSQGLLYGSDGSVVADGSIIDSATGERCYPTVLSTTQTVCAPVQGRFLSAYTDSACASPVRLYAVFARTSGNVWKTPRYLTMLLDLGFNHGFNATVYHVVVSTTAPPLPFQFTQTMYAFDTAGHCVSSLTNNDLALPVEPATLSPVTVH